MTSKEFFGTYGGKLAAVAATVQAGLVAIATDPTAAILLSDYLPGPWRVLAIVVLGFSAWVLPKWTAKKDAADAPVASE